MHIVSVKVGWVKRSAAESRYLRSRLRAALQLGSSSRVARLSSWQYWETLPACPALASAARGLWAGRRGLTHLRVAVLHKALLPDLLGHLTIECGITRWSRGCALHPHCLGTLSLIPGPAPRPMGPPLADVPRSRLQTKVNQAAHVYAQLSGPSADAVLWRRGCWHECAGLQLRGTGPGWRWGTNTDAAGVGLPGDRAAWLGGFWKLTCTLRDKYPLRSVSSYSCHV